MIVLLNLLVTVIVLAAIAASYFKKSAWPLVIGMVVVLLYNQFQPSYMPKGVVTRTDIPAFTAPDAKIESRLLSPKGGDTYDKRMQERVEEGLPFLKE